MCNSAAESVFMSKDKMQNAWWVKTALICILGRTQNRGIQGRWDAENIDNEQMFKSVEKVIAFNLQFFMIWSLKKCPSIPLNMLKKNLNTDVYFIKLSPCNLHIYQFINSSEGKFHSSDSETKKIWIWRFLLLIFHHCTYSI